ncbi:13054_t:CDS:2 [Entrophospora sp. SA101]|nr:13054_t:CDS:2 [Entrophospora sp. SA101]
MRAERQSLASKARRNIGVDEERMGKKPDVMMLVEYREKIIELLYTECSRIFCSKTKKADDRMKLWEETLDGLSLDLTWNFSRIIPDMLGKKTGILPDNEVDRPIAMEFNPEIDEVQLLIDQINVNNDDY